MLSSSILVIKSSLYVWFELFSCSGIDKDGFSIKFLVLQNISTILDSLNISVGNEFGKACQIILSVSIALTLIIFGIIKHIKNLGLIWFSWQALSFQGLSPDACEFIFKHGIIDIWLLNHLQIWLLNDIWEITRTCFIVFYRLLLCVVPMVFELVDKAPSLLHFI